MQTRRMQKRRIGGDIGTNDAFSKILSIGYEFETSDLTKLSRMEGDNVFVNSNINPALINSRMNSAGEAAPIDEHSYEFMDPMAFYSEYVNELDDARTEIGRNSVVLYVTNDIGDSLFKDTLQKRCERIQDKVDKNEMYWFLPGEKHDPNNDDSDSDLEDSELDVFDINTEEQEGGVGKGTTDKGKGTTDKGKGTTDKGKGTTDKDKGTTDKGKGKGTTTMMKKSNLNKYKVGDEWSIQFTEDMYNTKCNNMSSVEFIITFFRPKRGKNIIMETFLEASRRIMSHLGTLKRLNGVLAIRNDRDELSALGKSKRAMYYKPGTNLYYLQSHPDTAKGYNLTNVGVIPQMTFRAYVYDIIPIMETILTAFAVEHKQTRVRRQIQYDMEDFMAVRGWVDALMAGYNGTASATASTITATAAAAAAETTSVSYPRFPANSLIGKTVHGYLFMILYKVHLYEAEYRRWIERAKANGESEEKILAHYFKDHLTFASRHMNSVLYIKLKETISEWLHTKKPNVQVTAVDVILQILNQPKAAPNKIYPRNKGALKTVIRDPTHPNYGDPAVSLISYFLYFDQIAAKDEHLELAPPERDWLLTNRADIFTSTYAVGDNHEVMLENRLFYHELVYFARHVCNIKIKNEVSLRQLNQMYKYMVDMGPSSKQTTKRYLTKPIGMYEFNPKTKRMIKKCTLSKPCNPK